METQYHGETVELINIEYSAGTNWAIHSASEQPNDPEEFGFDVKFDDGVIKSGDEVCAFVWVRFLQEYKDFIKD